jgi:LysR family hydrogen peroxide-inducible transcriptional activator
MTITQLEYVIAVDTYRSFVAAANKCFVTQPTLSMQIQKLEDTLGVKLFDRSHQPVIPTEIGEEIIAQARCCWPKARK